jgi:hypothetical protein
VENIKKHVFRQKTVGLIRQIYVYGTIRVTFLWHNVTLMWHNDTYVWDVSAIGLPGGYSIV